MKKSVTILGLVFLLASCGNNSSTTSTENKTNETAQTTVEEKEEAPKEDTVHVVIKSDDNMKFDKSEIKVSAGQVVKLTLKHIGTMPKTAMGHNFVLLKKGVDMTEFGNEAVKAAAPEYNIPDNLMKDVIASTRMIGGGEEDVIEFKAPKKGSYTFLCSFPGHYGIMNGVFIVE